MRLSTRLQSVDISTCNNSIGVCPYWTCQSRHGFSSYKPQEKVVGNKWEKEERSERLDLSNPTRINRPNYTHIHVLGVCSTLEMVHTLIEAQ